MQKGAFSWTFINSFSQLLCKRNYWTHEDKLKLKKSCPVMEFSEFYDDYIQIHAKHTVIGCGWF